MELAKVARGLPMKRLLAAVAFLERVANPSETEIRAALDGHICRCGSHVKIVNAVRRAATLMKKEAP